MVFSKPEVVLRRMTADDIDAVLEIETSSFSVPWSRQSFTDEMLNDKACYIVADVDGIIAGYLGMWFVFDEADIMNVAVLPKWRGQGIGSKIVARAVEEALTYGCKALTLEVRSSNQAALSLYTKMGFVRSGLRKNYYTKPREDAVIMWFHAQ